ncbi:LOW QUALITY PROTEIN: RING finger protein 17 [Scomber scombrus]|uniref:LOW QUALITY PROTEIN: RING finger protein 17 n=1 Tax=Scomber scombrus TaxID=13677 RepID=A0AAV1P9J7_SCOSC
MDRGDSASAVTCTLCGEAFSLPEDEVDGNLPRVLLCSHIYCTSCLQSIECSNVIRCPECEVESSLPEGGVYGLQEDSRIIGLIYTAKINNMKRKHPKKNKRLPFTDINANTEEVEQLADIEKIEKVVDEALARATENLAQLEHIYETLTRGLAKQVKREQDRLVMEIKQAAGKAVHAVQKWKDVQLNQLTKFEEKLPASQSEVCRVQERMKALEIAMQMAREVRRVPFLEQYCTLDKVLETLQAPVDKQSFDMNCITQGSGMSCVFQSEGLNQSLALSLKMEVVNPRHFPKSPPKDRQPGTPNRNSRWQHAEGRNSSCTRPGHNRSPSPQHQEGLITSSPSLRESFPTPRPHPRSNLSRHSSASDLVTPDVIIEEFLDQGQENAEALPPTGPELANDKWRSNRKKKKQMFGISQWVVVTHVVNPSHFYVRYVAERRGSENLSKKIYRLCSKHSSRFSSNDTVETGSKVFVKSEEGIWCRASVVEVFQTDCRKPVKACPVTQLASVQVYFLDYGFTKSVTIQSEDGNTESLLKAVNNHLKKVKEAPNSELGRFVSQAIRCSLKDLVPYDLTKGWSKEAQVEFQSVVGSAAVEMHLFGQDRDTLLVDLRKCPMDQSSQVPISVREYLVFIEVARLYSPVTLDRRPLLYYPPNYPKINTELNAVVSNITNPADFHIQLVDNMESLLLSAKLQECYNVTSTGEDVLDIYCPVIGQPCVARFDDKLWYRAQIIGHPGGRKVEVLYVDFGNTKILSVSDLRKIKDEFFALPSLAIHCCLSDVFPLDGENWSDACIKTFISLAHQKLVTIVATASVPETELLPVKLFDSSLNGPVANIAELLVKEELACFRERLKPKGPRPPGDYPAIWDPPLNLGSLATESRDAPSQNVTREQEEEPREFDTQLKICAKLKDLKVRVSHVNSPSSFYVQFTQCDSQLKSMCERMKKECEHMEAQDVVWKADMYCAAHINGVWERGQICSDVTSSNIAEVIRCDHGNRAKLHVSNLRPLPPSLMGALAVECTLTDIRPAGGRSTWTATACDFISYYLTGAQAVLNVKEFTDERPVHVTLFCSNRMGQFVSIADFLAKEGLALKKRKPASVEAVKETDAKSPVDETQADGSDSEKNNTATPTDSSLIPFPFPSSIVSSLIPPKPAPRTIMSAEKVKTQLYLPPELPCLGNIQMTISAIGEDGLIYAQAQNAECQLEQLRERIQQSMKTLPRQKPYTWKMVQGCAVIGPDMLWYRGQLLELLGGHVKVQYVDYGLVENIPVVHVYPVLLCEDVPQLCMPCKLHRIKPVGGKWQQDAIGLLREMLLSRCVDMQIMELPADPRAPLTVEIFLDNMSLSRILCQHEHASSDRTASAQKRPSMLPVTSFLDDWDINTEGLREPEEPVLGPFIYQNMPQEGEEFKVRVKHLWTPNELFLWPLEGTADVEVDRETLDEALDRINANIDSLPRLTTFPEGGPCLAEYSDGKYYRAKLMKFTSLEPIKILVQHVDFGSDDTLPTSKLRQIPAELLQFPSRALKVRVAGFKAPSVNRHEDKLPYSPGWSVKAAMEMIDLLHCNITATVLARNPELKVLLYNEEGKLVHLPLVRSGLAELE